MSDSSFSVTLCCICLIAVVVFFVCVFRVEVEGFNGLLTSEDEEPYPEQNRFD